MSVMNNIVKSKVVIISKNRSYSYLVEEILSKSKEELLEFINASDIKNGMEKALWENPHLIIVDIDKNLEDIEKLDFFYQNKLSKNIPVLLLVDISTDKKDLEKMILHRYDFILKPLNHKELKIRAGYLIRLYKNYLQSEINHKFLLNAVMEKRESEVEKRKRFFKSFINACDNLIAVVNSKGEVLEINRSWIRWFGSRYFTNRILKDKKLLKKYVPTYEEKSFLNDYDSKRWMKELTSSDRKVYNLLVSKRSGTYLFKIDFEKIPFSDNPFKDTEEDKYLLVLRPFDNIDSLR